MNERQELWCHECQQYVQFDIDLTLNGNHVIVCPNCGHEHCRVVENGKITEARWDCRNVNMQASNTYLITTGTTSTAMSTYNTYSGIGITGNQVAASSATTIFTYDCWLNSGTGNGGYI